MVNFCTKSLLLGILSSTVVRAVVVAKLVVLGILFLTSFILALRAVVVAKLVILVISPLTSFMLSLRVVLVRTFVISGILFSIFWILAFYTSFLMTSFFTASLSLLKSAAAGTNLSTSNWSTLHFKLLNLFDTFFSLSISNLSTSDFKLAKLSFLANFNVSTPVGFSKFVLLHN